MATSEFKQPVVLKYNLTHHSAEATQYEHISAHCTPVRWSSARTHLPPSQLLRAYPHWQHLRGAPGASKSCFAQCTPVGGLVLSRTHHHPSCLTAILSCYVHTRTGNAFEVHLEQTNRASLSAHQSVVLKCSLALTTISVAPCTGNDFEVQLEHATLTAPQ